MKGHRSFPFGTVAALDNKYRHSTLTFFFFFFFTWRKSARTPGGSAGLQPTKTSTMTVPVTMRPGNRYEQHTGPLPRIECIVSGAAVQGSLVPLPDRLAVPIYQCLSLTSIVGSGGPKAPCPSAYAASAAPPPVDPLGVGAPHTRSLCCFLPKHNLLTEGGHGPPPSLARQQCPEDRRRREVPSDFHDEIAARPRPRRTELQRVLRRIHARIAVVATRGRFLPDSVQVFIKAPVPGEHLRHPISQEGPGPIQPNVPVWKDGLENP